MIAIVDYEMGNVKSVYNAINYLGEKVVVTSNQRKIVDASHIILPGVGAFGKAIENLDSKGLIEVLNKEGLEKGKPFLGICLGMQLIAKVGYEYGEFKGFGWADAYVEKIDPGPDYKLPHMGWNDIRIVKDHHPIFDKLYSLYSSFYFVHSYSMVLEDKDWLAATCEYGIPITAAVIKDNIIATQFHPEKSQDNGIQVLENFIDWRP